MNKGGKGKVVSNSVTNSVFYINPPLHKDLDDCDR